MNFRTAHYIFKHFILATLLFCPLFSNAQTVEEGLKFLSIEQYTNARAVFNKLLAQNNSAESHFYMGYYHLKMEAPDSADLFFRKGLSLDPKYLLNQVGVGMVQMYKCKKAEAKMNFDAALKATKNKDMTVIARVGEAYTAYENCTDFDAAVALLKEAAEQKTVNEDIFLTLGDAYMSKTTTGGEAVSAYEKAIKQNPKSARAYIRIGKIYVRAKNYNEALKYYRQGIDADPGYSPGYRETAELLFKAGRYAEAVENYAKYIEMSDNSTYTLFKYAKFLYLAKEWQKCKDVLTKLKPTLDDPVLYRLLGHAEHELGNQPAAEAAMKTFFGAAKADQVLFVDYEYMTRIYLKSGQDSLAAEFLIKTAQMDSAKSRNNQYAEAADIYFKLKSYKKAAALYEQYIALGTYKANNLLSLGKAYFFEKDNVKADTTFGRLIAEYPAVQNGYIWRARVKVRLDPESSQGLAQPYYEKFVELILAKPDLIEKNKKDLVEAHLYLGYRFVLLKNKEKADINWNKALEYEPGNARAQEGLKFKF